MHNITVRPTWLATLEMQLEKLDSPILRMASTVNKRFRASSVRYRTLASWELASRPGRSHIITIQLRIIATNMIVLKYFHYTILYANTFASDTNKLILAQIWTLLVLLISPLLRSTLCTVAYLASFGLQIPVSKVASQSKPVEVPYPWPCCRLGNGCSPARFRFSVN